MIHQGETLRFILKKNKVKQADFTDKMQWRSPKYIYQFLKKKVYTTEEINKICEIVGEDKRAELMSGQVAISTVPINDPKDQTILYQKELIDSQKDVIAMLKEKVKLLQSESAMNVPEILKNMHKQSELVLQEIGEIKSKMKLVKA